MPLTRAKGLTDRTIHRLLAERARGPFASLADFHRRVKPVPEEMEAMIRAGGFDEFGQTRTRQFWETQYLHRDLRQQPGVRAGLAVAAALAWNDFPQRAVARADAARTAGSRDGIVRLSP